jgi:hypothetical protein
MNPFREIERELLRFALDTGHHEGYPTDLPNLERHIRQRVSGIDNGDILDAIKKLHGNNFIRVRK